MKLAEGGSDSTCVKSAYEDLLNTSGGSLNTLAGALTDSDNILGSDNLFANEELESVLSALNSSNLHKAHSSYRSSKNKIQDAEYAVVVLTSVSSREHISSGAELARIALVHVPPLLSDVRDVLDSTVPIGDLSHSELNSARGSINSANSSIISSLNLSELIYSGYYHL